MQEQIKDSIIATKTDIIKNQSEQIDIIDSAIGIVIDENLNQQIEIDQLNYKIQKKKARFPLWLGSVSVLSFLVGVFLV